MTCSTLFTALITPFLNEKIDLQGVETLISRQLEANIPGLLVLGSTAEASSLTREEKDAIYHCARRLWNKKSLMVGVGALATHAALEEIKAFPQADLLLVASPCYSRPTQAGLEAHFLTLAEKTDIPLVLYNHPKRTGVHLLPQTVLKLSEHPNIVGIKETCFENLPELTVRLRSNASFSVWTGNDLEAYAGALLGTQGTISTLSNLLPRDMLTLMETALEKDIESADALYGELSSLMRQLDQVSNPIALKAAMRYFELPSGAPRLPLLPLDKNLEYTLNQLLEQCAVNSLSHF